MTWLEISKSALQNNVGILRSRFAQRQLWPCVKANAYGHGVAAVVSSIDNLVDGYCVVSTKEALLLRTLTAKTIMVLNIVEPEDVPACAAAAIILPLAAVEQVAYYQSSPQPVLVHIEIDTGMARTGFLWPDPAAMLDFVRSLPTSIRVTGLFSHYAAAGENDDYSRRQYQITNNFVTALQSVVSQPLQVHIDKSASLWNPVELQNKEDGRNIARPGVVLYGLPPTGFLPPGLRPVLSWKTQVIAVRQLPPGSAIGYGLTYTTANDATIATVPIGYCEGYHRSLSNTAEMLVHGQRAPVRGRVCMDLTMIEVPPDTKIGDEVVIIGRQGEEMVSAAELGKKAQTTHYEIVSRLPAHLPRRLVE